MHEEVLALCEEKFKQFDEEREERKSEDKFLHKRISDTKDEIRKYTDNVKEELKTDNGEILKEVKDFRKEFDKTIRGLLIAAFCLVGTGLIGVVTYVINFVFEKLKQP